LLHGSWNGAAAAVAAAAVAAAADLPAMGRFTLRDEGRTIAIGKVTKLPKIH
jgi:peptide chain release factor subunit 3